jgi:hypothetical protein
MVEFNAGKLQVQDMEYRRDLMALSMANRLQKGNMGFRYDIRMSGSGGQANPMGIILARQ